MSSIAYVIWALLALALLVLWLHSCSETSGTAQPVQVVRRLASGPFWRVAFVVVVMFLGWHLFAR